MNQLMRFAYDSREGSGAPVKIHSLASASTAYKHKVGMQMKAKARVEKLILEKK